MDNTNTPSGLFDAPADDLGMGMTRVNLPLEVLMSGIDMDELPDLATLPSGHPLRVMILDLTILMETPPKVDQNSEARRVIARYLAKFVHMNQMMVYRARTRESVKEWLAGVFPMATGEQINEHASSFLKVWNDKVAL